MTTDPDRRTFLGRLEDRLDAAAERLEARNLPGDAARYLRQQERSRKRLAKAVAAWAQLGHTTATQPGRPMPVTTIDARNAAGHPITVTVLVNITPAGATP